MKYACLVYLDEKAADTVSDRECLAFGAQLRERGQLLAGQALQPTTTATVVRIRHGAASCSLVSANGPSVTVAETREQLAGFYLIEATDLNDAIRIASAIPPARVGSIEVRPVRELDPT